MDRVWYHTGALGSITELTDDSQVVAGSYEYSAFGTIISESGTIANPFTYTAREYDSESGLYYYRARYYDAEVGRFLSRDPLFDPAFISYSINWRGIHGIRMPAADNLILARDARHYL